MRERFVLANSEMENVLSAEIGPFREDRAAPDGMNHYPNEFHRRV